MTDLHLTWNPTSLDRAGIERDLARRIRRRSLARWALPAATLVFLGLALALGNVTRDSRSTGLWAFPTLAFFLTHDAVQHLARRQFLATRNAAPIRSRTSTSVTLGPSGIVADGAPIAWPEILETLHLRGATLLLLLPDSGIAIPDTALPPGLTHDALAARIAAWKSA